MIYYDIITSKQNAAFALAKSSVTRSEFFEPFQELTLGGALNWDLTGEFDR